MADDVKPAELAARLADEIEAVARDLGLDPKRSGNVLLCPAPWGDRKKRKLSIRLTPIAGQWIDYHTGDKGDALGLVGCVLTGQSNARTREARREGIRWARDRYGLTGGGHDREAWARAVAAAKARQEAARKAAAARLKRDRGVAEHIWIEAEPLRPTRFNGTVAQPGCAGARYYEARGIDFKALGLIPRAIRLSPREHWVELGDEGQIVSEHWGPALAVRMDLHGAGGFGALHRTWINPEVDGEKADLTPARKMWPSSEGTAMRLWRGEHFLSETEAAAKGLSCPLVVCEGVEDALSIAMMTPEFRVHAAGSLPGLLSYEPPTCASRVIVAADNDWGKPQAQALLAKALTRLRTFGKPVAVARSPEGKDFNDLLTGRA